LASGRNQADWYRVSSRPVSFPPFQTVAKTVSLNPKQATSDLNSNRETEQTPHWFTPTLETNGNSFQTTPCLVSQTSLQVSISTNKSEQQSNRINAL
jgi:hypothetical protein